MGTIGGVRIVEGDPAYDSNSDRLYAASHGVIVVIWINREGLRRRGLRY